MLFIMDLVIDLDLSAHRRSVGFERLLIDPIVAAVASRPRHHPAPIMERGYLRQGRVNTGVVNTGVDLDYAAVSGAFRAVVLLVDPSALLARSCPHDYPAAV